MRNFPTTVTTALNNETFSPITLYEVFLSTIDIRYYAEYDEDILFAGITYTALPIKHSDISKTVSSELSHVTVSVANANRAIGTLAETYRGLCGHTILIKTVFADYLDDTTAVVERFYGIINAMHFPDAATCDIEIVSCLDVDSIKLPRRLYQRIFCTFKYKDPDTCKYSGSLVGCIKTVEDCKAHDNTQNYGGFPLIPTDVAIRL